MKHRRTGYLITKGSWTRMLGLLVVLALLAPVVHPPPAMGPELRPTHPPRPLRGVRSR